MNKVDTVEIDEQKNAKTAIELKGRYTSLVIKTDDDFKAMETYHLNAKTIMADIEAHVGPVIRAAHDRHKKLTALRARLLKPFEEIRDGSRRKCIEYTNEQRRIQEEAQRKVMEAQRKVQEDEILNIAASLEASGQKDHAQAVMDTTPVMVVLPVVDVPKLKGIRKTYFAEIVDLKKLCMAIGCGGYAMPALTADDLDKVASGLHLHDLARALKDAMVIPGVAVRSKE